VEQGQAKDVVQKLGNVNVRHLIHDYKVSERVIKLHLIKSGVAGDVCAETVVDCCACLQVRV
jgi:hypothetical protein